MFSFMIRRIKAVFHRAEEAIFEDGVVSVPPLQADVLESTVTDQITWLGIKHRCAHPLTTYTYTTETGTHSG